MNSATTIAIAATTVAAIIAVILYTISACFQQTHHCLSVLFLLHVVADLISNLPVIELRTALAAR